MKMAAIEMEIRRHRRRYRQSLVNGNGNVTIVATIVTRRRAEEDHKL